MASSDTIAKEKVEAFFIREFGKGVTDQVWTLKRGNAPWDSLRHIELINAFELQFSLQLNFDEACSLSKAEDFVKILESR